MELSLHKQWSGQATKTAQKGSQNNCMIPQKTFSIKQLEILEKSDQTAFIFLL